jgi:hypothetical protein
MRPGFHLARRVAPRNFWREHVRAAATAARRFVALPWSRAVRRDHAERKGLLPQSGGAFSNGDLVGVAISWA